MQLCVSEILQNSKRSHRLRPFFMPAELAQLDRARHYECRRWKFESFIPRHAALTQRTECLASNEVVRGSNPLCCAICCPVAQWQSRVLIRLWSLVQVQPGQPRYGSTIGQCAALIRQMMLVRVQPVPPYFRSSDAQLNWIEQQPSKLQVSGSNPDVSAISCLKNRSKF